MQAWEYLTFSQVRDAQIPGEITSMAIRPPKGDRQELPLPDAGGEPAWEVINRLGRDGWELTGPPNEVKVAMTYKNKKDVYMDYADWAVQTYYFKRPAQ